MSEGKQQCCGRKKTNPHSVKMFACYLPKDVRTQRTSAKGFQNMFCLGTPSIIAPFPSSHSPLAGAASIQIRIITIGRGGWRMGRRHAHAPSHPRICSCSLSELISIEFVTVCAIVKRKEEGRKDGRKGRPQLVRPLPPSLP